MLKKSNSLKGSFENSRALKQQRNKQFQFKQQKLIYVYKLLIISGKLLNVSNTYFMIGIIFIIIGLILFIFGMKITQIKKKYNEPDSICNERIKNDKSLNCDCSVNSKENSCSLFIFIDKKIFPPIYFYYEIGLMYQNKQPFFNSKHNYQLQGQEFNKVYELEEFCGSYSSMQNFPMKKNLYDQDFDNDSIASPCGKIAAYYFQEKYELYYEDDNKFKRIKLNESDILTDIEKNLYQYPENYEEKQWVDVKNEHFIQWMQPGALNRFRKLWGRIDQELLPGTYLIFVKDLYRMQNITKYVVLSNSNFLGQNNLFLTVLFFVVGFINFILLGVIFHFRNKLFIIYSKKNVIKKN